MLHIGTVPTFTASFTMSAILYAAVSLGFATGFACTTFGQKIQSSFEISLSSQLMSNIMILVQPNLGIDLELFYISLIIQCRHSDVIVGCL